MEPDCEMSPMNRHHSCRAGQGTAAGNDTPRPGAPPPRQGERRPISMPVWFKASFLRYGAQQFIQPSLILCFPFKHKGLQQALALAMPSHFAGLPRTRSRLAGDPSPARSAGQVKATTETIHLALSLFQAWANFRLGSAQRLKHSRVLPGWGGRPSRLQVSSAQAALGPLHPFSILVAALHQWNHHSSGKATPCHIPTYTGISRDKPTCDLFWDIPIEVRIEKLFWDMQG